MPEHTIFDPPEYSTFIWFADGVWYGECPEMPGVLSHGHSKEQAWANVRDARNELIDALTEMGLDVPPPGPHSGYTIICETEGFVPAFR